MAMTHHQLKGGVSFFFFKKIKNKSNFLLANSKFYPIIVL